MCIYKFTNYAGLLTSPEYVHVEALFRSLFTLLCMHVFFQPERGQTMRLVDLAGAPSEFSHYVYWKRQHMVKVHVCTHLHTCMYLAELLQFSISHRTLWI